MKLPYHQGILTGIIPLSIGGGIGQSRTLMLLLRKAYLGEISDTAWPKILKKICANKLGSAPRAIGPRFPGGRV